MGQIAFAYGTVTERVVLAMPNIVEGGRHLQPGILAQNVE